MKTTKIITIPLMLLLVSCIHLKPPVYELTEESRYLLRMSVVPEKDEFESLIKRAKENDIEACLELYRIYTIAFHEDGWAFYYLKKAAVLDNSNAEYNLSKNWIIKAKRIRNLR